MVETIAALVMLAGALLALAAGIGQLRTDDLYLRMHAATKPATLGWFLVVTGAVVALPTWTAVTKLVLALALQFFTAPVAAHLVGRASYRHRSTRAGEDRMEHLDLDELGEQLPPDEL